MTRKLTSLEISIARNLFHVREKYPFPSGRRQGVVSLSFQTGKVSNFAEKDYCKEEDPVGGGSRDVGFVSFYLGRPIGGKAQVCTRSLE